MVKPTDLPEKGAGEQHIQKWRCRFLSNNDTDKDGLDAILGKLLAIRVDDVPNRLFGVGCHEHSVLLGWNRDKVEWK